LEAALDVAAGEAFKDEVIDPEMQEIMIGEGKEYYDRADWIRLRIEYWIEEAAARKNKSVTVDGLTLEDIEWNIYLFGADVKKYTRKRDAATKDHTRSKWQKKLDEATKYLKSSQRRLERAATDGA
jgi:hypothetical protein